MQSETVMHRCSVVPILPGDCTRRAEQDLALAKMDGERVLTMEQLRDIEMDLGHWDDFLK